MILTQRNKTLPYTPTGIDVINITRKSSVRTIQNYATMIRIIKDKTHNKTVRVSSSKMDLVNKAPTKDLAYY